MIFFLCASESLLDHNMIHESVVQQQLSWSWIAKKKKKKLSLPFKVLTQKNTVSVFSQDLT